jgi:hypothetical protein
VYVRKYDRPRSRLGRADDDGVDSLVEFVAAEAGGPSMTAERRAGIRGFNELC